MTTEELQGITKNEKRGYIILEKMCKHNERGNFDEVKPFTFRFLLDLIYHNIRDAGVPHRDLKNWVTGFI